MNFPGSLALSAIALFSFQIDPATSGLTSALIGFIVIMVSPSMR